jgi:hypothetical protein
MKKLVCIGVVLGLLACGGGGGGVSTPGGGTPTANSNGQTDPAVAPQKPLVDYLPYFLDVFKGNYTVDCGPNDLKRTSAVVKVSADGFLTPWLSGSLDIRFGLLGFNRALKNDPGDGSLIGGFGGTGGVIGGDAKSSPIFSINSDGGVIGLDNALGIILGNPLGGGEPEGRGIPIPGSILACGMSPEAARFANLSAYTAFAKIIDAKKTPLLCLVPNSTTTISETYEVSGGELKFQGKAISLLTGIKSETFASAGALARTNSNGTVEYVRNPTYQLKKLDGTEIGLTYNEYGEMVGLTYKDGLSTELVCLPPA